MKTKTAWYAYWAVVAASFAAASAMLVAYTPVEATMGPIQKVFYLHLPVAINAFVACAVAFVGGLGYLWQRRMAWDDLSAAGAKVAALLCTIVLAAGAIWGRVAWGHWWTWSPKLTFSLLLWLLYVAYLIIRPSIKSPPSARWSVPCTPWRPSWTCRWCTCPSGSCRIFTRPRWSWPPR